MSWWLLVGCASRPLPVVVAPPSIHLAGASVGFYEVEGHDRSSLLRSLLANGPKLGQGAHVSAATEWAVHWHVPEADTGRCDLHQAYISRDVRVQLPHWADRSDASPALRDEWDAWIEGLARHEQGHVHRVHAVADDILPAMQRAGCARVVEVGDSHLAWLEQANDVYDDETNFGADQGASIWWDADVLAELVADGTIR